MALGPRQPLAPVLAMMLADASASAGAGAGAGQAAGDRSGQQHARAAAGACAGVVAWRGTQDGGAGGALRGSPSVLPVPLVAQSRLGARCPSLDGAEAASWGVGILCTTWLSSHLTSLAVDS
ncbi:unnamed protein product [Prorocentrum cordatum]|uniref:Secreted protein n=1 Tax=Prorocentrum cordatum TaxID=2364126 RepID=A0ABN9TX64_9DINO|nr:unnamed protein product [Polarella glacialis]